MAEPKQWSF